MNTGALAQLISRKRCDFCVGKLRACAVIVSIGALCITGASAHAQMFKSSKFLTWDNANQSFYIEASVGMASLIAARSDRAQGDCIDDWYYSDEPSANAAVLDAMRQYPDVHPRGIILAVIQQQCGDISKSER